MTHSSQQRVTRRGGRGRLRRELRRRVALLHEVHEGTVPDLLLHTDEAVAGAFSMRDAVRDELQRRRRRKVNNTIHDRAVVEAQWALDYDPSTRVCAAYGLERALHASPGWLPYEEYTPDCFVGGTGYTSQNQQELFAQDDQWEEVIKSPDKAKLRNVPVRWDTAATGVVPATWTQEFRTTAFDGDPVRPPVEVLALAADVLRGLEGAQALDPRRLPRVLGVGLGWAAGAEALSTMLPTFQVHHAPLPYDDRPVEPARWRGVVLNVAGLHEWRVGRMLGRQSDYTPSERLAVLRGRPAAACADHVPALLQHVRPHLRPGVVLAILAAHGVYQDVIKGLMNDPGLEPHVVAGINTDKHPIWVGYKHPQWAPHELPTPTGRLMSFWRVAT